MSYAARHRLYLAVTVFVSVFCVGMIVTSCAGADPRAAAYPPAAIACMELFPDAAQADEARACVRAARARLGGPDGGAR